MKTSLLRIALLVLTLTASLSSWALSPGAYTITYSCGTYDYNPDSGTSLPAFSWTCNTLYSDISTQYGIGTEQFDSNYASDLNASSEFKQYELNTTAGYPVYNGAKPYIGVIKPVWNLGQTLKINWSITSDEMSYLCALCSSGMCTTISRTIRFASYNQDTYSDLYITFNIDINYISAGFKIKADKPTISYTNGQLDFQTQTSGAEIVSEITVADAKKSNTSTVSLTQTYNITAYATKSGYTDSDVATATLVFANGTLNNTTTSAKSITVDALPLLISQDDGMVTISGMSDGDDITAYSADGKEIAKSKAIGTSALLNLSELKGKVAVLNVNGRSAKVMIK